MAQHHKPATGVIYTLTETAMGWLLVARTERGLSRVALGDDPAGLESELVRRYGHAGAKRDDEALRPVVDELLAYLAGEEPTARSPLDVSGSDFQRRVWRELARIPRGTTITYAELARRIGKPTATRAVAGACAANPVAIITPCHRVVRADGGLGGYRWGVDRKRAILEAERASVEAEGRRALRRRSPVRATR